MNTLHKKIEKLNSILIDGDTPTIAYSGGIDSGLLLYLATQLRKGDALGILVVTPAQSEAEIAMAVAFAKKHTLHLELAHINVFNKQEVAHNHKDRCYHCKKSMLRAIQANSISNKCSIIYDGTIADDSKEYRPGAKALTEESINSPLKECGFSKTDVRDYAKSLGLEIWDKPSSPCLLTRFPYDMIEPISTNMLRQIEQGENILASICLQNFRLRWEDNNHGRIEASTTDMKEIIAKQDTLIISMGKIGFAKLTLDLLPFKSGSFDRQNKEHK